MLEAEKTRPKVEREVKQLQEWADERAREQRQQVLEGLRKNIKDRNE